MPAFASRRRPARFGRRKSLLQRAFDANHNVRPTMP